MVANKKDGGTTVSGTMVVAHKAGIQVCLFVVVVAAVIVDVVVAMVPLCGRTQKGGGTKVSGTIVVVH